MLVRGPWPARVRAAFEPTAAPEVSQFRALVLPTNPMNAHRLTLATLASLCALVAALALSAAQALATSEWRQVSSFGSGILSEPYGVAVDQADGDVFVANHGNVQSFIPVNRSTPSAGYTTGTPLAGPFQNAVSVAVDGSSGMSSGEVYVVDAPAKTVYKYIGPGKAKEGEPGVPAQIGAGASPLALARAAAVAVDPANGDIYVSDSTNGVIDIYEPSGAFLTQFATGSEPGGLAFDGSGSDLYVYAEGAGRVEEYDASGQPVDQTAGPHEGENIVDDSETPLAMSVNPVTDDVYVFQREDQTVAAFASTGAPLTPAGFSTGFYYALGLGVDGSTGAVDVSNLFSGTVEVFEEVIPPAVSTGTASHVSETSATLEGTVDPEGAAVSSCEFEYGRSTAYGDSAPCVPSTASIGSGTEPVPVHAEVSGLEPRAIYHFRLVAGNASTASQGADQTFGPPIVEGESFSEVYVTSAWLSAQVNTEGRAGDYWFEYGTSTTYGTSSPHESIPAGGGSVEAAAHLSGLETGATYHARVVVADPDGTTQGADFTLITYSPSAYSLPDGRVLEMVTPVDNEDANVYELSQEARSDAIQTERPYQAAADGDAVAYVGDPTSGGNGSSGGGGGNEYLATRTPGGGWSQSDIEPLGYNEAVYQAFSSNLSIGILTSSKEPTLSPEAPGHNCAVLYSHTSVDDSYHPFFTTKPLNRTCGEFDSPRFGGGTPRVLTFAGGNSGTGAVPEFTHLPFEANASLTKLAEEDPPSNEQNDLYDSVNGQLSLVNVLPDGKADPYATFGSAPRPDSGESPDFSDVISADGSRIFWTDLNTGDLYVRENDTSPEARTVQVSAGAAQFWTATSDGRYAYYTEGEELYRFDVESETREQLAGAGAGVEGVIGAGEDGSYLYFVAGGQLAEGAAAGQPNLYLLHEGKTKFIATLAQHDDESSGGSQGLFIGDWNPDLGLRTSEVTPDGQSVTFMSNRSLTGYVANGAYGPLEEVFVYDADINQLFCASCTPSGESPPFTQTGRAAYLPVSKSATYMPRRISADGSRVFFDSNEPLVPQDTNGQQDVYEWERDGAGGCEQANGCVYLLSGGTSTDASVFVDASVDGDDVFILSRAQLAPEDQNDNFNLFDAHAEGVQPSTPAACSGTGCQGVPPAPPIFATPSSVTFNGIGNFPPPPARKVVEGKSKRLTKAQKLAKALRACHTKRGGSQRRRCDARARARYASAARAKRKIGGRR
jgi:DNA-binding beta-propeller fold protein YncE